MKRYVLIGWRLTQEEREKVKNMGLHIYAARSWDEGNGCTLEHRVIVNHEADVITDFEALDESNREDRKDNLFKYMNEVGAVDDGGLYEMLEDVIA